MSEYYQGDWVLRSMERAKSSWCEGSLPAEIVCLVDVWAGLETEVSLLALIARWACPNSQYGGLMTNDPVCGMRVNEEATEFHTMFAGRKYYFCSAECREEFEDQPADYVEATAA